MTSQAPHTSDCYAAFRTLHEQEAPFVLANAWDAMSARILTRLGFPALGTTSAGASFALGKLDSAGGFTENSGLTLADTIGNARQVCSATTLPVTVDLEGGYGTDPAACGAAIRAAMDIGACGGSIEDATGDARNPIFEFDLAVERVAAASEAKGGHPFLLTARTENYLYGNPDLADTIRRLQAFADAGADVLFAPGLNSLADISTICREVPRPVSVLMGIRQPTFSVEQLAEAGVKRISVGAGFARAAIDGLRRAALEVRDRGTFLYSAEVLSNAEASGLTVASTPGE